MIAAITIEATTQITITTCIAIQNRGIGGSVTIGASIFIVAVGAILRYAVEDRISGIELATVGLILMIAGIVGLVAGMALLLSARDRDPAVRDRDRLP